jgi:putative glutathione S-transferase
VTYSVVNPDMGPKGWSFASYPGATGDQLYGHDYMYELYRKAQEDYSGIVTVPVLWDKERKTIVNNESSEIIRMLNSAFDEWGNASVDLYPEELRPEIDRINERVYEDVNNRVYRVGFASTQKAYEKNFKALFDALDYLEERLGSHRYLVGNTITEADWRLFTTLLRFDAVYVGHFKCNKRRIADYPNLFNYMLELYQWPGVAHTVNFDHIKRHYYFSHVEINPTRIVPLGPEQDLTVAHDRARFASP